jgi:hypothetical protein
MIVPLCVSARGSRANGASEASCGRSPLSGVLGANRASHAINPHARKPILNSTEPDIKDHST